MIRSSFRNILHRTGRRLIREDQLPLGVDLRLDLKRVMRPNVRQVIDVGGNRGQSVIRFAKDWPNARIDSFEPTPDLIPELNAVCEKSPNARAHAVALGRVAGSLPFYCYKENQCNSFTKHPELDCIRQISIPVQPLDGWMEDYGVDEVDLLKIDVEGAECDVLKGADRALREGRIHSVLAETTLYQDDQAHTAFECLRECLAPIGFYFISLQGQFNRVDNHQFVYADALFVHRSAVRRTGRTAVMPVDAVGMR